MRVDDVTVERTPHTYCRWVATTSDVEGRFRGPTPATALYRLHAALYDDAPEDADAEENADPDAARRAGL